MLRLRRNLFLFSLLASLQCCAANSIMAQQFSIRIDANDDGTKSGKEILASLKQMVQFRYQGKVKEYQDLLGLDEPQGKKLSFAAKGAALHVYRDESEKIVKSIRQSQQRAGLKVDLNDLDLEDDQEDQDDSGKDQKFEQGRSMIFSVPDPNIKKLESDPIWQRAISKILTADQLDQFKEGQKSRETEEGKKLVEAFLVKLRHRLFVDTEQIEKLRPILAQEVGPALLHNAKTVKAPDRRRAVFLGRQFGGVVASQTDYAKLVLSVLDPQQQVEWKRSISPELDPIVQAWRRRGMQGVNIQALRGQAANVFRAGQFGAGNFEVRIERDMNSVKIQSDDEKSDDEKSDDEKSDDEKSDDGAQIEKADKQ